jgi:hypothetical protein
MVQGGIFFADQKWPSLGFPSARISRSAVLNQMHKSNVPRTRLHPHNCPPSASQSASQSAEQFFTEAQP